MYIGSPYGLGAPPPAKPAPARRPPPAPVRRPPPTLPRKPPPPRVVKPARPIKSPAVGRLQNALRALGARVKDKALVVVADGLIGPKTVSAVNLAFTKYVVGVLTPAKVGRLTAAEIVSQPVEFATLIEREAARRAALPRVPPPAKVPPKPPMRRLAQVAQLQKALRALGKVVKDGTLAVVVDGTVGPKTVAAANRAFSTHIKAAPAALRTGKLAPLDVRNQAMAMVRALDLEIIRRGFKPPPAAALPEATTPEAEVPPEAVPEAVAPEPPTEKLPPGVPPEVVAARTVPPAVPSPAALRPPTEVEPPYPSFAPPPPVSPVPAAVAPPGPPTAPAVGPPGEEVAPGIEPEKKFPLVPVLIGVGVLGALGVTAALLARGGGGGARPRRRLRAA